MDKVMREKYHREMNTLYKQMDDIHLVQAYKSWEKLQSEGVHYAEDRKQVIEKELSRRGIHVPNSA